MTSPFDPPKCTLYTLSSSQCNLWSVCDIFPVVQERERLLKTYVVSRQCIYNSQRNFDHSCSMYYFHH